MGAINKPLVKDEFIIRAVDKHGYKCKYDKVIYIRSTDKINIYCNVHKEYFKQAPKIHLYEGSAEKIFDLEIELHKKYKDYRYKTIKKFDGYSECYSLVLPIEEIINIV